MRQVPARTLAEALGAGRGDLVALVGGGGKTTAMYRLVEEWRAAGLRGLAATTTRIAAPAPGQPELCAADTWEALRGLLEGRQGRPLVLGGHALPEGKVRGVPPEWCGRVLAEGLADAVAVEADGAARLPVKAPAEWEPVVPEATSLFVAVVGLSCVGTPLDAAHVFRPELVAAATGVRPGEPLGPRALVRLLAHPQGLAKGRPPGARAAVLLNQADGAAQLAAAEEIARGLLGTRAGYERVVAAALGAGRGEPAVRAA
ncbi:MAG: selenium cofactor biosynthesis protein YqeC, partial [Thermodesulfobacteriota bacterium]